MISRDPPKARRQNPSLRIATGGLPDRSSSGVNSRPGDGCGFSASKAEAETKAADARRVSVPGLTVTVPKVSIPDRSERGRDLRHFERLGAREPHRRRAACAGRTR